MAADSAGTRVVTYTSMPEVSGVGDVPATSLGGDSPVADELFRVRGAVLLSDGSVAVANAGTQEVLFFSADGRLEARAGGEGKGPGEFSNLFWVQGKSDGTVVASDPGNARLVEMSADGEVLSSRPVLFEPEDFSPDRAMVGRGFVLGTTSAGEILAVPWARADFTGREGPLPLKGEVRRYSPDLAVYAPVDSVVLRTWFEKEQPSGPPIAPVYGSPVFLFSASQEWLAYTEGRSHRIVVVEEGDVAYVVQEDRPRTVSRPDSAAGAGVLTADSLPAYTALLVDSDGRVWARPGTQASALYADWRLFSERGARVDLVRLPATSTVLDARGDRLVLLERDDLDVERLRIRHLAGGGP